MNITTNTKLLLNDGIMAIVITTKGRWVKIQRADRAEGDISNISFADAAISAKSYDDWYTTNIEIPATEAEVEEMMEPAAPSMLSTLINFKGEEPKAKKAAAPKFDGAHCPICGSEELWMGTCKDGLVQDNDVIGCHSCGWLSRNTVRKNGIVKAEYLQGYQKVTIERADGQKLRTFDKGDSVAVAMRGMDLNEAYEYVAEQIGQEIGEISAKYGHLNNGQQRMCLGNLLRGHYKKLSQQ